ncbi:MAG: transposase zinc-binding domain-containing protein [Candidatus Aminicenantes bacterium]|nr:transposase zinc-binding domain-containing protein [Candidatus Aminicenantes bacterium]
MFYRVFFHYFERFLREYEDRFEREYGFFRPVIKDVVEKYLDCGNLVCGFARIRCPDCGEERLLMFSCKTRGFCPSCHAKGWAEMIRKVYEVDPLRCPSCGGRMRIIYFIEEPKTIDKIIRHLELTFEAERPPPPHNVQKELLMAAEEKGEYF